MKILSLISNKLNFLAIEPTFPFYLFLSILLSNVYELASTHDNLPVSRRLIRRQKRVRLSRRIAIGS